MPLEMAAQVCFFQSECNDFPFITWLQKSFALLENLAVQLCVVQLNELRCHAEM